ncbi:MAG: hypothetical protein H8F28_22045 [Fibrella sp.]|nr:hypothetical protein [Armatimonadota bacterium]
MQITTFRRPLVAGIAGAIVFASAVSIAFAHEAPCAFCKRDIVQDTKSSDNETALRFGRKRIEYRSVFCALSDAQNAKSFASGNVTILAPSEKKGLPIAITRTGARWSVPEGTVFLGAEKVNHAVCAGTYRAFTNRAALDAYVKANPKVIAPDAKPLTFAQLLTLAKDTTK